MFGGFGNGGGGGAKAKSKSQAPAAAPVTKVFIKASPPESKGGGGGLFGGFEQKSPTARPVAKEKVKAAPKGVPTLSRWTCTDDLTVSGFVSNSPNFTDGERITTSALSTKENQIKEGAVVVTGSGSKYYLS